MIKIYYIFDFLIFFFWDLTLGAFRVASDVVTKKELSSPGIIRFPLKAETDFEIGLLSTLITFSPGSMVIDIDEDRSHLYIHIMFLLDKDQAIKEFRDKFEARVLRILR
jgi:multicomponent Na+:H+ antiporter subunit E